MDRKNAFYEDFASRIISVLEGKDLKYEEGWTAISTAPVNAVSKRRYNGLNFIYLAVVAADKGWKDPRWMTFLQAKKAGYKVKKGSKSTPVIYFEMRPKKGAAPTEVDALGNPMYKADDLFPMIRFFNVFNATQIEGIPELEVKTYSWNPCEKADSLIKATGAKILHDDSEPAYSLTRDVIHLPEKIHFKGAEEYYETVLHELAHWTGAPGRLGRKVEGIYGYAAEELVAEIASWMLCEEIGIRTEAGIKRAAAYVDSWRRELVNAYKDGKLNPESIVQACKEAGRAFEYIMSFS